MTEILEIKKHYLYPSAIFAEREDYLVDTVLGSCVAVCLYDTKLKIGGINHYMLPLWNGEGLASPKYGNIAIEKLIEKMNRMGAREQTMIAKVFGGANQIGNVMNIGERNIQIAIEMLKAENIRIVAENTGGPIGRKIRFNSGTGEVLLKMLSRS